MTVILLYSHVVTRNGWKWWKWKKKFWFCQLSLTFAPFDQVVQRDKLDKSCSSGARPGPQSHCAKYLKVRLNNNNVNHFLIYSEKSILFSTLNYESVFYPVCLWSGIRFLQKKNKFHFNFNLVQDWYVKKWKVLRTNVQKLHETIY